MKLRLTEKQLKDIVKETTVKALFETMDEWGRRVVYSDDDKLELVKDPNVKNGGNFPITRAGKEYWVSRSNTISLYVFCLDENGEWNVLASKRGLNVKTNPGVWNVVCGFLDYGYTLEGTAVKEAFEETGVKINRNYLRNLGTDSKRMNSAVNTRFACILPGVVNKYPTSTANCEPGEVTEAAWIPLSKVNQLKWMHHQNEKVLNVFDVVVGASKSNRKSENVFQVMRFLKAAALDNEISDEVYQRITDLLTKKLNESVNGTHVTPSGNISTFSLDFLGQGEKTGKNGKGGGLQHTDGIYISINPIGNAKFHKTYGQKEIVRREQVDSLGRGGYKVYTYFLQIPDLSRKYYLFEYEPIKGYPHILTNVNDGLVKLFGKGSGIFLNEDGTIAYSLSGDVKQVKNEPFIKSTTLTCANYYRLIKELFFNKDGKKTSEFFAKCGVIGLIYHGHQDALCAVIYNPKVIKIVNKKVYNVKKEMSGDELKRDYIANSDYLARLEKYNNDHPQETLERSKYNGHIANKPKNYVARKKYDPELNFQYPVDGAFKNDKPHNVN